MFRAVGVFAVALLQSLLHALPLAAQETTKQAATDSTVANHASEALLQLLEKASRGNRMPDDLIAFKARIETEIAVLLRRAEGAEQVASIEQVASTLRWTRAGYYDQRVIGHRASRTRSCRGSIQARDTGAWILRQS